MPRPIQSNNAQRHFSEFELNDGAMDCETSNQATLSSWTVESISFADDEDLDSVKSETNGGLSDMDVIEQSARVAGIPQDCLQGESPLRTSVDSGGAQGKVLQRILPNLDVRVRNHTESESESGWEEDTVDSADSDHVREDDIILEGKPETRKTKGSTEKQMKAKQMEHVFFTRPAAFLRKTADIDKKPSSSCLSEKQTNSNLKERGCSTPAQAISLLESKDVGCPTEEKTTSKQMEHVCSTPMPAGSSAETIDVAKKSASLYKCPLCKKECQSEKDHICSLTISAGENPVRHFKVSGNRQDGYSLKEVVTTMLDPMSQQNAAVADKLSKKVSLKLHLRTDKTQKPFQCNACNVGFTQMSDLMAHLKTHANQCPVCDKFLPDDFAYREHVQSHVTESGSDFECPICQRHFLCRSGLALHLRSHGGSLRPKTIECPTCKKTFRDPHHLRDHVRTHTGAKPFTCPVCRKAFTQKSSITRHLAIHAKPKFVKCIVCDEKFLQESKALAETQETNDPYKCDDCVKFIKGLKRKIPPETIRKRRKLEIRKSKKREMQAYEASCQESRTYVI